MLASKLQKARLLIKKRPYLIWYSNNLDGFSEESIFESIINYGDWEDFLEMQNIFGIKTSYSLFKKVINKKRSNIRPQTKNYFEKYFTQYA